MPGNLRPRAKRKTKPCLCCGETIVQGMNEGTPYFTRKKFCSQKCNAKYRKRVKPDAVAAKKHLLGSFVMRHHDVQ